MTVSIGLGRVQFFFTCSGLGWVTKNGPMDNSEPAATTSAKTSNKTVEDIQAYKLIQWRIQELVVGALFPSPFCPFPVLPSFPRSGSLRPS